MWDTALKFLPQRKRRLQGKEGFGVLASLQTLRPLNPGLYFGCFILIFTREACNTWAHDPSLPVALGKPLILRAPGTCPHWTHVTRDYVDAREKVQN